MVLIRLQLTIIRLSVVVSSQTLQAFRFSLKAIRVIAALVCTRSNMVRAVATQIKASRSHTHNKPPQIRSRLVDTISIVKAHICHLRPFQTPFRLEIWPVLLRHHFYHPSNGALPQRLCRASKIQHSSLQAQVMRYTGNLLDGLVPSPLAFSKSPVFETPKDKELDSDRWSTPRLLTNC